MAITAAYKSNQQAINRLVRACSKVNFEVNRTRYYVAVIGEWVTPETDAEAKALEALFEAEGRYRWHEHSTDRVNHSVIISNAIHWVANLPDEIS